MAPDQYYSAQNLTDGGMSAFPPYTPVGMCYVPMQKITTIYEPEVARRQGTLFPDLDKPFLGGRGRMQ